MYFLGISPRSIVVCRRFGTLYQFHLQGQDIKYEVLHTLHQALEDGTLRGFRNVGKPQSNAGKYPKEYILNKFIFLLLLLLLHFSKLNVYF
jgi:hypothetical protein